MKLKLEISPNIVALMQAEIAAGEKAVTTAMREAGAGLKSAWRGQITGAGLGTRLGNSIRLATYPKGGESLNLDTLRWVLIAIALIGIAVTIHARIDNWKRGQR